MKQYGILSTGKKVFFTLLLTSSVAFAGMVDAIALVVNDTPITLYDIEKRKVERNLSKEEAVSQLVDEALFQEIVEKNNNFQIFSQVLFHFSNSDNSGIVWLAKKTGIKNNINELTSIDIK